MLFVRHSTHLHIDLQHIVHLLIWIGCQFIAKPNVSPLTQHQPRSSFENQSQHLHQTPGRFSTHCHASLWTMLTTFSSQNKQPIRILDTCMWLLFTLTSALGASSTTRSFAIHAGGLIRQTSPGLVQLVKVTRPDCNSGPSFLTIAGSSWVLHQRWPHLSSTMKSVPDHVLVSKKIFGCHLPS